MKLGSSSPRGFSGMSHALPTSISSIVVSVGGLALFLIFASWALISYPIVPTVHSYFMPNLDNFRKSGSDDQSPLIDNNITTTTNNNNNNESVQLLPRIDGDQDKVDKTSPDLSSLDSPPPPPPPSGSVSSDVSSSSEIVQPKVSGFVNDSTSVEKKAESVENEAKSVETGVKDMSSAPPPNPTQEISMPSATLANNSSQVVSGSCDLYHGKWFHDSSGPLYTNNTCPVLTQMQNCQGNGRPDKDYENWRWKPSQCDLPRFDAKKFLELMRGKTLAFIGDSVARNQMESMLCILWQVEVPKNRGNRHMQRWYFKSTSVMIVRIWSSWLVHSTSDPFDYAPAGVSKLHLDVPDDVFMGYVAGFDVIVLSSGHWFAKQSVYIYNNEILGGQLWWPDKKRENKINNIEAFGISVETILTALATHPNYTGITIVRSFSPDHYEGGAWNTGGSCTGKVRPALDNELVENGFTNIMHEKQVMGFNRAVKKAKNQSKLKLMDITEAFSYRHDGHPGPYRSPDPKKITKRGPNGEPPPQDCLHWCMPGPVDTWNELVLEIISREYGTTETFPA